MSGKGPFHHRKLITQSKALRSSVYSFFFFFSLFASSTKTALHVSSYLQRQKHSTEHIYVLFPLPSQSVTALLDEVLEEYFRVVSRSYKTRDDTLHYMLLCSDRRLEGYCPLPPKRDVKHPEQHYQILYVSKPHCNHCDLHYLRTSLQRYIYLCLPLHRSRNFSNKPNKKEINTSLLVFFSPLICKFSNCGLWQRIADECTLERNHRCYNFKKDTYKTFLVFFNFIFFSSAVDRHFKSTNQTIILQLQQ